MSYRALREWYFDREILMDTLVNGGNGIGKRNAEGRMLLEFCDEERELCVANAWFKKKDKRKITFKSVNNE